MPLTDQEATQNKLASYSPCEAEKWHLVPTHISAIPSSAGFKTVEVSLAVENTSAYWGQINTTQGDPIRQSYLETGEGDQYPAAEAIQMDNDSSGAGQNNAWRIVKSQLYTQSLRRIPPGFAIHGETMIGFDVIEYERGSPNTWSQAVFQVPDQAGQYLLTIPSLTVSCVYPDGQKYDETTGPIQIDLDAAVRQPVYPTSRLDSDFESITQPITVPELGLLEFQGAQFQRGMAGFKYLVMDFKYTRTSLDSDPSKINNAILVGDDGLTRRVTSVYAPPGCSTEKDLDMEPGQLSRIRLCYLAGSQAEHFKFLWVDETAGIFKVYNLPGGF